MIKVRELEQEVDGWKILEYDYMKHDSLQFIRWLALFEQPRRNRNGKLIDVTVHEVGLQSDHDFIIANSYRTRDGKTIDGTFKPCRPVPLNVIYKLVEFWGAYKDEEEKNAEENGNDSAGTDTEIEGDSESIEISREQDKTNDGKGGKETD